MRRQQRVKFVALQPWDVIPHETNKLHVVFFGFGFCVNLRSAERIQLNLQQNFLLMAVSANGPKPFSLRNDAGLCVVVGSNVRITKADCYTISSLSLWMDGRLGFKKSQTRGLHHKHKVDSLSPLTAAKSFPL